MLTRNSASPTLRCGARGEYSSLAILPAQRQWVDDHGGNAMYLAVVDGDLTLPTLGLKLFASESSDQVRYLYKNYPPYEAAKFEAHFVVSRLAAEYALPLTNIELSGVIGNSRSGKLGQPHGLEMMMRALYCLMTTLRQWQN